MGSPTHIRATAFGLAATLATTGLAVLFTGVAAHAAPHFVNASSVQIGYTDSATPSQAYDEAERVSMPIGTRIDESGAVHTSRVYATFDLRQFAGKHIFSGKVHFREAEVVDCTKRAIEIWETQQIRQTPSWRKAPKAKAKLDELRTVQACPGFLSLDVDDAVIEAVRKGKERISFEIRVPADVETDPSFARKLYWFSSVNLTVEYNTLPTIDDRHMYHGGQPCDTTVPFFNERAGWLQGMAADADPNDERSVRTEFAVWPQDDPSARRVYTSMSNLPGKVSGVTVPASDLQDGRAYSWQYRAGDGVDTSAWSRVCGFVFDVTRPGVPTVSSSNYPEYATGEKTPVGEPGVFTFSGGGDPDIVGFQWGFEMLGVGSCGWMSGDVGQHECPDPFSRPRTVRADAPGGSATVLISPNGLSRNRLLVRSIDKAGSVSEETEYAFFAPWENQPVATTVGEARFNRPVTVRLAAGPGVNGTTRFEYQLDNGPVQILPAGPDGTATFTFSATREDWHHATFRSFSANGFVSVEGRWDVFFNPWPSITSDIYQGEEPVGGVGVPGTFTFHQPSSWLEVKGYLYSINGAEPQSIDAGPGGEASLTWAPETSGFNYFEVWAVRPDGTVGNYSGFYWFDVA